MPTYLTPLNSLAVGFVNQIMLRVSLVLPCTTLEFPWSCYAHQTILLHFRVDHMLGWLIFPPCSSLPMGHSQNTFILSGQRVVKSFSACSKCMCLVLSLLVHHPRIVNDPDNSQRFVTALAQRGFIVLAFDQVGFASRLLEGQPSEFYRRHPKCSLLDF